MSETATEHIITCNIPGPRNNYGKNKLVAKITEDGLYVWCKTCQDKHFLRRDVVIAAWERGESVQCEVAPNG